MVGGGIDVHDEVEVVDVYAPGRDVRRHQGGDLAVLELFQGAVALRLGPASVQCRRPDTDGEEPLGEPVGGPLGVEEEDDPAVPGRDARGDGLLVGLVLDVQHVVLHGGHRSRRRVHGVHHGVGQEPLHQAVDVAVQGGREEQALPVGPHLLDQLGDLRQEAHVGHLVGFVQHRDPYVAEHAVPAFHEVVEPAGGRHEHLGAAPERSRLLGDGEPADHGGQPEVHRRRVGGQRVGHLLGEFTGGHQHQGEGCLGLRAQSGRAGQERQPEREGLAGAGASPSQQIPAGERVGQRGGLDGKGGGHALRGEGLQQPRGHVEGGEVLDCGKGGCGAFRQPEFPRRRRGR